MLISGTVAPNSTRAHEEWWKRYQEEAEERRRQGLFVAVFPANFVII